MNDDSRWRHWLPHRDWLQRVESYRGKAALRQQKIQLENDKQNRKRQSSKDSDNHPKEPMK